jgi:DNA-binding SARP family transcriptional activator
MSAQTKGCQRLGAISRAALYLIALATLWQLRPSLASAVAWPTDPASTRTLLEALLWITLVALALTLLLRVLRSTRRPPAPATSSRQLLNKQHRRSQPPLLDLGPTEAATGAAQPRAGYEPSWTRPRLTVPPHEDSPHAATAPSRATLRLAADPEAIPAIPPHPPKPRILLLGPLEISTAPRRRRPPGPAHELIAYLALHPEGATRDQLLEALWPNQNPKQTEQRLWQATREARKLVNDAIVRDAGRYRLDRNRVALDLEQLDELLNKADGSADEREKHRSLEQAYALFRGPPLQDSDYAWADSACRRLTSTHAALLERLAEARLQAGDPSSALEAAEQGITADGLNERFWRLALRAEAATGSREAVTARYERLTATLEERLGLAPDRDTRTLVRELLSQH